jgi:hypothetical protein
MPGGNRHTTTCKAGSDCILFRDASGDWDVNVVQAPAAKE